MTSSVCFRVKPVPDMADLPPQTIFLPGSTSLTVACHAPESPCRVMACPGAMRPTTFLASRFHWAILVGSEMSCQTVSEAAAISTKVWLSGLWRDARFLGNQMCGPRDAKTALGARIQAS